MKREMLRPWEADAHTDFDGEDVAIYVETTPDGERMAYVLPARAKRLEPLTAARYRDLLDAGGELARLNDEIDHLVAALREDGVSWSLIAHALGLSGEAARQRWGP